MRFNRLSIGIVALACGVAMAPPALAQGKSKGLTKGRGQAPAPSTAAASAASGPVSVTGIRQFGAWLDDASLVEPGAVWAAMSLGHFRSSGGHQTDFPIVDGGIGLSERVQLAITVPYYHLTFADGSAASGLGDVYLATKIGLINPGNTSSGFGLAVSPLVEILSDPDPTGGRNFHFGAPVSAEWRQPKYRLYGSSGWFSRGAFFASGALEIPVSQRFVATGALVHTRALNEDVNADALGLSKARTDVTGGVAYFVTPTVAAFGSVGRTISAQDANAASFMCSFGMSVMVGGSSVRGTTRP
jgi:hypothetical protein